MNIQPENLLHSLCLHSGQQGGTIHEFIPRLKWKYDGRPRRHSAAWWCLMLDNHRIASISCEKVMLPKIDASLASYRFFSLNDWWEGK